MYTLLQYVHCVQEALRKFTALKRVGENKSGKDVLNR